MIRRIFLDHPCDVGETYSQHASIAASFGGRMLAAGAKCLVHAIVPSLFPTAGSDAVRQLHRELDGRQQAAGGRFIDYVI